VPLIDATGLVALESALMRLQSTKTQVVLSGPLPQPRQIFERADLPGHYAHVRCAADLAAGIALARELQAAPSAAR
jgi:anti-anti-sigma regulatory factor